MRRIAFGLFMMMACAETLSAQLGRRAVRSGEPSAWIGGGVGFFTANGVNDGRTSSTWDFGSSTNFQYRLSLEKAIANQSSFGIVGTYVRVPFIYSSTVIVDPRNGASCAAPCEAHLDMMTVALTFHAGGGPGFHQVLEASGGIAQYTNLERDSDGAELAPTGGSIDPIFAFGYGFGYGFNNNTQINLVQDYGIALHERSGLANGVSNTNTVRNLRFSVRFGFGSQSRRR